MAEEPRRAVIRTPDQRVRVFVSSTLQELAEERESARKAISRLRLAPVMFELGARPHPARALYRAYLEQSHIFVGIYWERYGWTAPDMDISGLEDEYRLAGQKPKLIYIKSPAQDREPGLVDLLKRIRSDDTVSYKYFSTPDELGELIENDLALLLTERFEMARAGEQPPERAADERRHNLPKPLTSLIGRAHEIASARELLLRDDVRLVTFTGPGGTGKTRLAIEVAEGLAERFEQVLFVALATVTDPELVAPTIAKALELREVSTRALDDVLRDYLCDRRMLLLLDNFEQIVAAAPLVAKLLQDCAWLKVIVTSRAPLHIRGEKEFLVPPLALPHVGRPGLEQDRLSQYAAVELFIQRALDVKPDFTVNNENAAAVAEICYRLDGLPLAIELAAARIRLLSPQALLARLEHRLPLLTGGARDLPDRQQTMRNAIEWSYDLLDEGEKTLFRRLSIFAGGFTLEAAEAVCRIPTNGAGHDDILYGVESLVDKSLLRHEERLSGESRFALLQTIREYARERLTESGEEEAIWQRYTDFYLSLVEAAEPHLTGGKRSPWMARLLAEYDNLRAVLAAEYGTPDCNLTALRMAGTLGWFWYFSGYVSEGRGWLEKALWRAEASEQVGRSPEEMACKAKALHAAGSLAFYLGDFLWARERLEDSVALWRELGDKRNLAYALVFLGVNMLWDRDRSMSNTLHAESCALFREVGDDWGLALALFWTSVSLFFVGNIAGTRPYLEESGAIFRRLGDKWGLVPALQSLSDVPFDEGDYAAARALLDESLALSREIGEKWFTSVVLMKLGHVALHEGNLDEAEAFHQESLALRRELGNKHGIAWSLRSLGQVAHARGDHQQALALYLQGLHMYLDVRDPTGIAGCLEGLAGLAVVRGDLALAARLLGRTDAMRARIGMPVPPAERIGYGRTLEAVRAGLSKRAFASAWAEGEAMSLDEALACVEANFG